jgi:hypothetical protein
MFNFACPVKLLFNRGARPRKVQILTTQYDLPDLRGRQEYTLVFRGLKFEPDTGIGQKGTFFKGLIKELIHCQIHSVK